MNQQIIKTPYGTVEFRNEWPPEKVMELIARYAHKINYRKRKEKGDAA